VSLELLVLGDRVFNLGGSLGETERKKDSGGEGFYEIDFVFHNIEGVSTWYFSVIYCIL